MIDVELLRQETLTDMINDFEVGDLRLSASGILPVVTGLGDNFSWDIMRVQRDIDTFEGKLSPAGTRKMQVIANRTARLLRSFKSTFVPGGVLQDLRNPGTIQRQTIAEDTVGRENKELGSLLDRQNEYLIARAIQDDLSVVIDDLEVSVDYEFSASHKVLLPGTGGNNVATVWNDAAAMITQDLQKWKKAVVADSGRQPTDIWTSSDVIAAMIENDFIQGYFTATPQGVAMLTEGSIGRFYGLNWHVYDYEFINAAGVAERFIPADRIIMTCQPSNDVAYLRRGSDVIPTDDKQNLHEVAGRYAYSEITTNPGSIALYAGEVRLPIIRLPDAFLVAKVLS